MVTAENFPGVAPAMLEEIPEVAEPEEVESEPPAAVDHAEQVLAALPDEDVDRTGRRQALVALVPIDAGGGAGVPHRADREGVSVERRASIEPFV